jgi:KTSC domain
MQRQPVESRALAAVGYDAEARELELEFRSGRVYRYRDVPASVYEWLMRAPNKGAYIARHITGLYPEQAVPDVDPALAPSLEQSLLASLAAFSAPGRRT